MNAIVCLPVDFETNSLGLPALLHEEIDSAPVLYHTVSRLTLGGGYRVVLVFRDGPGAAADVARAREILADLDCEYLVSGAADVANREFLRRGRLWSLNSWRGGMGWTSYWDEAGRPAALAEAAEKFDADAVGLITPDSPYADPHLASQLLEWHYDRIRKAQVTVTGVPPGLAPAFFSRDVVKAFAKAGLTLAASTAYKPSAPQRDLATTEAHFEADIRLRLAPWRLTAHSPRQLEMMRGLCRLGASPRNATAVDVVEMLGRHSELWSGPVPAKIEIEPTTRTDAAPFYLGEYARSKDAVDMPLEVFDRIVASLAPHRDVLISLEGLGEPMLHDGLAQMVAAAKDAGLLGVHVATGGRLLNEAIFQALADRRLDVLSVHVGAASDQRYERLFGTPGLEKVRAGVEEAFALRRTSEVSWPLIVAEMAKIRPLEADIEPFFDYWLGKCDWPVIRPYNDFAGQITDYATVHMRTSRRVACRKIFNEMYVDATGTAWPCRQDINRTRPLGNVAEEGVAALWHCNFMENLRAAHVAGDYDFFPLCANCKDWYYST